MVIYGNAVLEKMSIPLTLWNMPFGPRRDWPIGR
jgi:hypothetical protein